VVLVVLAFFGIADWLMSRSYHDALGGYSDLQVTLAPTVNLQSLPWNDGLPSSPASQFALAPDGYLVVNIGGTLYDFDNGKKLMSEAGSQIQSFAFVSGALAVITADGHLGYASDESFTDLGKLPQGPSRIAGSDTGDELFLHGGSSNYSLLSFRTAGDLQTLASSPEMIEAVAGNRERHVFSVDSSLFIQSGTGRPRMLLDFPDARITGLAINGSTIYCATGKGIYQLAGALAVPLVLGMGGQLSYTPHGLLVLNSENGRLYRLALTNDKQ